ncbi:MAG: MarR family transcriptional regulator, partial [Geodermatophilaceae bacterium]|nr:MarR family transcriptional regulator [Geodermatophilaceae bacterium]
MAIKRAADPAFDAQVDAVMAASRVLVAVSAQSMDGVDEVVSPIQMRTLVILAGRGAMRAAELAEALGVHPSNATRACDKLVAAGLLDRRENPQNRRTLIL